MNKPNEISVALKAVVDIFERLVVPYFIGGSVASSVIYLRRWAGKLGIADLLEKALAAK